MIFTNGINASLSQDLTYDDLGRIATIASGVNNESFTYDANGNRTHKVLNGSSIAITIASDSNHLLVSGGTTYGYDADGNVTTANTTTLFHYDPFGRVDGANGTWVYSVGAEDQRLREGGLAQTYFAPDRSGVLLAEDLSGTWQDYVYLNGKVVAVTKGGAVFSVHSDQVNRPLMLTNAAKAAVWQAEGLPFTTPITSNSFGAFNLGFPGQYEAHGHTHNGYREYNGYLGRYAQSDPIGLAGGVNTYAYVGNNPITRIDPLGLCDQQKCTALQQQAAQMADALEHTSHVSEALAGLGAFATAVGVLGEPETLGIDTPYTVSAGEATQFFGTAAAVTGGLSAGLHSFAASGDPGPVGTFTFKLLMATGVKATAAASHIPGISRFADNLGQLAGQAVELSAEAQAACQNP